MSPSVLLLVEIPLINFVNANEDMKDNIFELQRKISIYD